MADVDAAGLLAEEAVGVLDVGLAAGEGLLDADVVGLPDDVGLGLPPVGPP